jgi:hypothetical protein
MSGTTWQHSPHSMSRLLGGGPEKRSGGRLSERYEVPKETDAQIADAGQEIRRQRLVISVVLGWDDVDLWGA